MSSGAGSHADKAFGLTTDNAMGVSYAVSKAALNALTARLAHENPGVLINAVCPASPRRSKAGKRWVRVRSRTGGKCGLGGASHGRRTNGRILPRRRSTRLVGAAVPQDHPRIEVASRAELRQWLTANHWQTAGIRLVTWKKGDPRYLPCNDIVEEALCFGRVDSLPRKLDAARSMILLSPRRSSGAWSKANKDRVARLTQNGMMTSAGLAKIESAKRSGAWAKLDAVEVLTVPDDLAAALRASPPAADHWEGFPRSVKRGILEWIDQAKRSETRAKRVAETATRATRGERANQWR